MPLRKNGYDSFDNTNGTIVRTAGYPEGFDGLITFGTLTFVAKKSGVGTIEFSGENLALDENNKNQYIESNNVALTVNPTETKQPTTTPKETQPVETPSNQIPEQLFDVNLELDQAKVSKIEDLEIRVVFTNFGTQPTSTDLTFDILDAKGIVVHTEKGNTTIITESIYKKKFSNFALTPGKYTLRLTTLYNKGVKDEFKKDFEVTSSIAQYSCYAILGICWWWWTVAIIILITIWILYRVKSKKRKVQRGK
jgi:hypothetical protein